MSSEDRVIIGVTVHDDAGRQRETDETGDELVELLRGRPRTKQYAERTPEELRGDVNKLTDHLCRLVRERDEQHDKFTKLEGRIDSMKWVIRGLCGVVSTEGLVIFWFATQLFNRIPR